MEPFAAASSQASSKCKLLRRRRTSWLNTWPSKVFSYLLALQLAQQICDTSNQEATFSHNPMQGKHKRETQPEAVRFVEEPADTSALLGEPAELVCLVDREPEAGVRLQWWRNGVPLGYQGVELAHFANRMSVVSQKENNEEAGNRLANFTLKIKSVQLNDDAQFYCSAKLKGSDKDDFRESRKAKLTVLKPPTQLAISAFVLGQESGVTGADSNSGTETANTLQQRQQKSQSDSATLEATRQLELASDEPSDELQRLVVQLHSRLRLECRADAAKPHAKLTWFDHKQRAVPKRDYSSDEQVSGNASYVEEEVAVDRRDPKLAQAKLSWIFRAERHHSNQLLTCQAEHAAFERQHLFPQLFNRELRRQILLDVHFAPQVSLSREPSGPIYEHSALSLHCHAEAKPINHLNYRWLIDEVPIEGATGPELRFASVSRQLMMREIRCEVSNSIGFGSASTRLQIRYSPAFVSHLLPGATEIDSPQLATNRSLRKQVTSGAADIPAALSRQLAIGFEPGDTVQLRCDFDSSPRIQQVQWFKITDILSDYRHYRSMHDVSPQEADRLIEAGALQAALRSEILDQSRPVGSNLSAADARLYPLERAALDYDRMSEALLALDLGAQESTHQMDQFGSTGGEEPTGSPPQNTIGLSSQFVVEQIANRPASQTSALIYEPLDWEIQLQHQNHQQQQQDSALQENEQFDSTQEGNLKRASAGKWLKLLPWPHQARLMRREAQISSSLVTLSDVKSDAMGRYVCKAQAVDGSSFARVVYLVQRQSPRIISQRVQWAPLNARFLQLECLTAISALDDGSTLISWFKDNKQINARQVSGFTSDESDLRLAEGQKLWLVSESSSPDLLFRRSTLRLYGAQLSDFGDYNCTISNSKAPPDQTIITLKPLAQSGFAFNAMASLAVGSLLVFLALACFAVALKPSRRHKQSGANSDDKLDQRDSKQNSVSSSTSASQSHDLIQQRDTTDKSNHYASSTPRANEQPSQQQHQQLANDSQIGAQSPSSNFAQIQSSLERQLNFRTIDSSQPSNRRHSCSANLDIEQSRSEQPIAKTSGELQSGNQAAAKPEERLVNRLWARFKGHGQQQSQRAGSRRSRPLISAPLGQVHHQSDQIVSSSSANLIQDSPTGSEAATSSSRSSSSTGHHSSDQRRQRRSPPPPPPPAQLDHQVASSMQLNQVQQPIYGHLNSNFSHDIGPQQTYWAPPSAYTIHESVHKAHNEANLELYAAAASQINLTPAVSCIQTGSDQLHLGPIYAPVSQKSGWQTAADEQHALQHSLVQNHYHFPSDQMQHYQIHQAADCCAPSQDQDSTLNTANFLPMGPPIPMRPASVQCQQQLIPTSDAGDAYLELNYDALICSSSAYKALGYHKQLSSSSHRRFSPGSLSPPSSSGNSQAPETQSSLPHAGGMIYVRATDSAALATHV